MTVAFVSHALGELGDPRAVRSYVLGDREQGRAQVAEAAAHQLIACIASVVSRNRLPKLSVPLGGRRGRTGWLHTR
jgi:hypothetical protein